MNERTKDVIDFLSALLTPTIGVITTYIAYRQYRVSKDAEKRDLLGRRLSVYKSCMAFLSSSCARAPDQESTTQFLRETVDAFFLFKPDIEKYLDEIYTNAVRFESSSKMLDHNNLPVGEQRTKLAQEAEGHQRWFSQQFLVAKNKFKPYLEVGG